MKSKTVIGLIFFLILLFYLYRITIEIKSKSVGFIINYKTLLNYYYNEQTDINVFIDKLLKYKIFNICIYPSTVADLLDEYNEISLFTGEELNLFFGTQQFKRELFYLVMPKELKDNITELNKYACNFFYRDYLIYGFNVNRNGINNSPVKYIHKFEGILIKKGCHIIHLKNEPILKNIDNFFIKDNDGYYLTDNPEQLDNVIKIHRFNKPLFLKEDIQEYIDENYRAILERNVKGIMINTLYYENKIVKLDVILPGLINKIENIKYKIFPLTKHNIEINNNGVYIYTGFFIFLIIFLFRNLFPMNKKYSLIIMGLSFGIALGFFLVLHIFYIIPVFFFFYLVNAYVLKLNKDNSFNFKNGLIFIILILFGGLGISNFLFRSDIFSGAAAVRGIKICLLLPFLMWIFQYIEYRGYKLKNILKIKIDLFHFVIINTALLLIGIIILRSGNFNLPVSSVELKIRRFLEDFFFIRPRFKEILFYPFLFLLFFNRKILFIKNNFFIIYFLALMAVVTTINSFLHIHTLSYYTIIRSLTGMGIGFIIGILVLIGDKIMGKFHINL